ncbi:acyltransferase [Floccifex sp.]|uniref:acyltransferase n=1 Tax=Floccifex sp. TaxID=2815810 RepID=UPI003EFF2469
MVETKKIESFRYMRVLACIGIVLLHFLNGAIGLYGTEITVNQYIISKCILNLLLWCVPIFVMITGALLLNPKKEISYKTIFSKYILRIIKALLFCVIIFGIFDCITHNEAISFGWIKSIILNFFQGTSWSHLWYLYLIIGLYLMLPIYRLVTRSASDKDIKYLLILYTIFLSMIPIFQVFGFDIEFYIMVSSIYPLYFFLGYAMHNKIVNIKKEQSIILLILSTIGMIVTTYFETKNGLDFSTLTNYSSIFVVVQSISIFSLMESFNFRRSSIINSIDDKSFGIYLIHMIFVRLLLKYLQFNPYQNIVLLNFILGVLGIFIISYLIVVILKHIPIIKKFI